MSNPIFLNLTKIAVFLFTIALCSISYADERYVFVVYKCDKKNDELKINYIEEYNEEGREILKNKDQNTIRPLDLLDINADTLEILKMKTITKKCQLSGTSYRVKIGPKPGSMNMNGRCGVRVSAWISIKKDNKKIYSGEFEGDCHKDGEIIVTREIRIAGKTGELFVKEEIQ